MNLIVAEIPDDPGEWPAWLDRRLVGLDLASLVAELEAVHEPGPSLKPTLDALLGDTRGAVLVDGLAALPPHQLRVLLRQPRLLLDLQEAVVREGGPYWDRLALSDRELERRVRRGQARLTPIWSPRGGRAASWSKSPWLAAILAAAAMLAVMAGLETVTSRPLFAPAQTAWGWSRPGAIPQDGTPADYFNRLADAANEWFRVRPTSADGLARRLGELRQGCSTLILAEHQPLAPADRDWLIQRCRAWAAKFDAQRTAIEGGADPAVVRAETDETVRRLITTLRDRSRSAV